MFIIIIQMGITERLITKAKIFIKYIQVPITTSYELTVAC